VTVQHDKDSVLFVCKNVSQQLTVQANCFFMEVYLYNYKSNSLFAEYTLPQKIKNKQTHHIEKNLDKSNITSTT